MIISSQEVVTMYARYCRTRFGKAASKDVRKKANALKKRGDIGGYDIWTKVAEEIEKPKPREQPPY